MSERILATGGFRLPTAWSESERTYFTLRVSRILRPARTLQWESVYARDCVENALDKLKFKFSRIIFALDRLPSGTCELTWPQFADMLREYFDSRKGLWATWRDAKPACRPPLFIFKVAPLSPKLYEGWNDFEITSNDFIDRDGTFEKVVSELRDWSQEI